MIKRYFPKSLATRLLLVIGTVLSIYALFYGKRYPFDDAFITFRYSDNLAHGRGLVWNVGGAPTEGYTNLLYVILLAPFALIGLDLLLVSQLINCIAVILSAILIYKICRGLTISLFEQERRWPSLLIALLFYATPLIWVNALSALETSAFAFLLLLAVYLFQRALQYEEIDQNALDLSFYVCFLAALTRPEGGLLGIIFIVLLLPSYDIKSNARRSFLIYFLFPATLYVVWKYFYFGALLPNSFLLKVESPQNSGKWIHGLQYERLFLTSTLAISMASLFALRYFARSRTIQAILLWCFLILAFYLLPEPLMGFYDRYLISVEVFLFILAGVGLLSMLEHRGFFARTILTAFLVVFHLADTYYAPRAVEARSEHQEILNDRYKAIAAELNEIPGHENMTLAFMDAGVIPYYSHLKVIDMVGLNNNEIARLHDPLRIISYLDSVKPDMFFIPVNHLAPDDSCRVIIDFSHGLTYPVHRQLMYDPRFRDYKLLTIFNVAVYDLALFVNERSPNAASIEGTLMAREPSHKDIYGGRGDCIEGNK